MIIQSNLQLQNLTQILTNAIDLQSQGAGTHQLKTQGTAISYILENDLESQFLAFAPNSAFTFTVMVTLLLVVLQLLVVL